MVGNPLLFLPIFTLFFGQGLTLGLEMPHEDIFLDFETKKFVITTWKFIDVDNLPPYHTRCRTDRYVVYIRKPDGNCAEKCNCFEKVEKSEKLTQYPEPYFICGPEKNCKLKRGVILTNIFKKFHK